MRGLQGHGRQQERRAACKHVPHRLRWGLKRQAMMNCATPDGITPGSRRDYRLRDSNHVKYAEEQREIPGAALRLRHFCGAMRDTISEVRRTPPEFRQVESATTPLVRVVLRNNNVRQRRVWVDSDCHARSREISANSDGSATLSPSASTRRSRASRRLPSRSAASYSCAVRANLHSRIRRL